MKKITLSLGLFTITLFAFCQYSFIQHQYNIPDEIFVNHIGVGDFNGDGKPDIVTAGTTSDDGSNSNYFFFFLSNSSDSLNTTPAQIPYQVNQITGLSVADMNHDNLDDIVIIANNSVYIYYQTQSHTFSLSAAKSTGNQVSSILVTDIDHDGNNDIVAGPYGSSPMYIFYGTSVTDSFMRIAYPQVSQGITDLKLNYIGHDTTPAIIYSPTSFDNPFVYETKVNNDRQLISLDSFKANEQYPSICGVAAGDRFGTGQHELAATGQFPGDLLYWNNPDSSGISNDTSQLLEQPQDLVMADLNCGGKDEIIAGAPGGLYIIDYAKNVTVPYYYIQNYMDYDDMQVTDVIGDSKPDIIIANSDDGVIVLENVSPSVDSLTFAVDSSRYSTSAGSPRSHNTTLYDTTFLNGNTIVVAYNLVSITQQPIDSTILISSHKGAYQRCLGDTLFFTDTTTIAVGSFSYYDTAFISSVYDTISTGITETTLPEIILYPNPFLTGLNVDGFDQPALFEIYNTTGELTGSTRCTGKNCFIPRDNLPQGIYLLKITYEDNVFYRKIIAL